MTCQRTDDSAIPLCPLFLSSKAGQSPEAGGKDPPKLANAQKAGADDFQSKLAVCDSRVAIEISNFTEAGQDYTDRRSPLQVSMR